MRQVQPQGPYLLGGFSGGGLIAWEIARQLEAAGEAVPLLVLLDTPVPLRPALSRRDKALIKLAELRAKGPGYLLEWARARREWKRLQAQPQANSPRPPSTTPRSRLPSAPPCRATGWRSARAPRSFSARRWTGTGRSRAGPGVEGQGIRPARQ